MWRLLGFLLIWWRNCTTLFVNTSFWGREKKEWTSCTILSVNFAETCLPGPLIGWKRTMNKLRYLVRECSWRLAGLLWLEGVKMVQVYVDLSQVVGERKSEEIGCITQSKKFVTTKSVELFGRVRSRKKKKRDTNDKFRSFVGKLLVVMRRVKAMHYMAGEVRGLHIPLWKCQWKTTFFR